MFVAYHMRKQTVHRHKHLTVVVDGWYGLCLDSALTTDRNSREQPSKDEKQVCDSGDQSANEVNDEDDEDDKMEEEDDDDDDDGSDDEGPDREGPLKAVYRGHLFLEIDVMQLRLLEVKGNMTEVLKVEENAKLALFALRESKKTGGIERGIA